LETGNRWQTNSREDDLMAWTHGISDYVQRVHDDEEVEEDRAGGEQRSDKTSTRRMASSWITSMKVRRRKNRKPELVVSRGGTERVREGRASWWRTRMKTRSRKKKRKP
jgi:hypothetical protein